jgi:hypothetical protein
VTRRALPATLVLAVIACAPTGPRAATPAASIEAAFASWDSLRTVTLVTGVTRTFAWSAAGPWAVHVLEIDGALCSPQLVARKPGPPLAARARTTELVASDLAGINADFFMLPGGTPVGAHVTSGRVLVGPGRRHALVIGDERYAAGVARLHGFIAHRGDTLALDAVNRPNDEATHHPAVQRAALLDEWYGDTLHGPAIVLAPLDTGAAGGRAVVRRIVGQEAVRLAAGERAVRTGAYGASWLRRRLPGDTLAWQAAVVLYGLIADEAVGGFPMLVQGGINVTAGQQGVIESFGPRRHPRTAVGWNGNRLLWVVVDGRQPDWSDGMTLDELASLFVQMGARHAINLDGGGSTAFVIRGQLVNRPSDADGEREVGNALALVDCEPVRGNQRSELSARRQPQRTSHALPPRHQ